jgi:hypothetical protein
VVRRVVLGPAVWLSAYSTTDRGSTSGSLSAASQERMLRRLTAWPVGAGREDEAGRGEASFDDVAAVLDPAEAVSEPAHEVARVGEGRVGLGGSAKD